MTASLALSVPASITSPTEYLASLSASLLRERELNALVGVSGSAANEARLLVKPLEGRDPEEVLLGMLPPRRCWALGVVTPAHVTVGEAGTADRVAIFVWPGGAVTALASRRGGVMQPEQGSVLDLLRRVLKLQTAPPEERTSAVLLRLWLDRALGEAAQGRVSSWRALVACHPLNKALDGVQCTPETLGSATRMAATRLTWAELRRGFGAGTWSVEGVDPALADWFDDGSFSRQLLGYLPSVDILKTYLSELLPPRVMTNVEITCRAAEEVSAQPVLTQKP